MRIPLVRRGSRWPIYKLGAISRYIFDDSPSAPSIIEPKLQLTIKPAEIMASSVSKNIKARDVIFAIAQNDNHRCQSNAISALKEIAVEDSKARSLLLAIAKNDKHRYQDAAICALGEAAVKDSRVKDYLLAIANNDNHPHQGRAFGALDKAVVKDPQVKSYVLAIAKNDNHRCQSVAILALGEATVKDSRVKDHLLAIAQNDNHRHQNIAIYALRKVIVEDSQVKGYLLKIAQNDNHRICQGAAIPALSEAAVKDSRVKDHLLAIAQNDNHRFQNSAIEALGEAAVKDSQVKGHLLSIAQNDNHRNQDSAIEALGEAAVKDSQVKGQLLSIAQNDIHHRQGSAVIALSEVAAHELKNSNEISTLAGKLTSFANRLRTRNGITIDQLLEGRHKGPTTNQKSLHFEQLREYQDGDPSEIIDANASARMGRMMVKESRRIANRNIMIVVDPDVLKGEKEDIHKKIATIAGMVAAVALRDGEQVGLVISGNYYIPAVHSENQLINILTAIYNSTVTYGAALAPLLSSIFRSPIRQDFTSGSRAVIISDFSKPSQEVGKAIKEMRSKRIAVTPVNVGSYVPTFPEPVINMGGMEMEVHPKMVELLCKHSAQKIRQDQIRFMRINRGRQVDLSAVSDENMPKVYAMLRRPVRKEEEPCSDYMLKGVKSIGVPDRSFSFPIDELTDPTVAARVIYMSKILGSSFIFSLFVKMGVPLDKKGRIPEVDEETLSSIFTDSGREASKAQLQKDYERLGKWPQDPVVLQQKRVELESFDNKSPFEDKFPGAEQLRSPLLYTTFGPTEAEIDEFSKRLTKKLEEKAQASRWEAFSLISPDPEVSPSASAVDKERSKGRVLAKTSKPLIGRDSYLPLGVNIKHDPVHCSYAPSNDLRLEDFSHGGGSKIKIRFRQIAEPLIRLLKPLGALFIRQGRVRKKTVELELAGRDPEFIQKLLNIPLLHFRYLAPRIFGRTLHEEATQYTLAWEELDKETRTRWQEVVEEVQTMPVRDAIGHIRNFVTSNYKYKQYINVELLAFEEFKERAKKGQAAGRNEYLKLIVSLGGGKCAELSEITLALLRAAGLPAAVFTGYVAKGKVIDSEPHRWAGVVLRDPDTGRLVAQPVETAVNVLEVNQRQIIQEESKRPHEVPEKGEVKEESKRRREVSKEDRKNREHEISENGSGELLEIEKKILGERLAEQRYLERMWEGFTEDEQRFVEHLLQHLGLAQRAKLSGAYFLSAPVSEMIENDINNAASRQNFERIPVFPPAPLRKIISYWNSLDRIHQEEAYRKAGTKKLQRFIQAL